MERCPCISCLGGGDHGEVSGPTSRKAGAGVLHEGTGATGLTEKGGSEIGPSALAGNMRLLDLTRFVVRADHLDDLVRLGTLPRQAATFLEAAVASGLNVLVAGDTQAGKITLLECLAAAVPLRGADRHVRGGLRAQDRGIGLDVSQRSACILCAMEASTSDGCVPQELRRSNSALAAQR